MNGLDIKD